MHIHNTIVPFMVLSGIRPSRTFLPGSKDVSERRERWSATFPVHSPTIVWVWAQGRQRHQTCQIQNTRRVTCLAKYTHVPPWYAFVVMGEWMPIGSCAPIVCQWLRGSPGLYQVRSPLARVVTSRLHNRLHPRMRRQVPRGVRPPQLRDRDPARADLLRETEVR